MATTSAREPLPVKHEARGTMKRMSSKKRTEAPAQQAVTQLRNADLAVRLESLMANATEHIRQERELLLSGGDVPRLPGKLSKRPVLIVNRRFRWQNDLATLKRWIKDRDPVLLAVGNGVEALLDAGYHPDVALGRLDELSDLALHECRHVFVAVATEQAKTKDGRLERFGVDPQWFVSSGKSSDLALLVADASDALVIVEAGSPSGLNERLDGSPDDVASSFVTRLRVSSRVVEAPAVARLSAKSASAWPALFVLLAGMLAVGAAVAATPAGGEWFAALIDQISQTVRGSSL
jgi:uncharacterized membrane-anchored protein